MIRQHVPDAATSARTIPCGPRTRVGMVVATTLCSRLRGCITAQEQHSLPTQRSVVHGGRRDWLASGYVCVDCCARPRAGGVGRTVFVHGLRAGQRAPRRGRVPAAAVVGVPRVVVVHIKNGDALPRGEFAVSLAVFVLVVAQTGLGFIGRSQPGSLRSTSHLVCSSSVWPRRTLSPFGLGREMLGDTPRVAALAAGGMTAMILRCGSAQWIRSRQPFLVGGHVL